MWQDKKGVVSRSYPPTFADEEQDHNYEEESDVCTARRLSINSFRWLWTANARADIQLKNAESSLTKERDRVRNAIERQQRSLRSRSVVLQSMLRPSPPRKHPSKNTRGEKKFHVTCSRPCCPTPTSSRQVRRRSPSCELPQITRDLCEKQRDSLRSKSDSDFKRHVTDTSEERRIRQRGHSPKLLSGDPAAQKQQENRKKDYLQVPLPRFSNRTHSL